MNSFEILPVTEQDFPALLKLIHEFAIFEKVPEKMTNNLDRMLAEKDLFSALLARSPSGDILGYAAYFFCYYTWTGKALYLDDLYVRPEHRGQSIGTRLLEAVIAMGRRTGCHKVRWQVSKWNEPAREFYKKMGASIDDVEENCDFVF